MPIGATWNTDATLFMGDGGEIAYHLGYLAMRNASIETCLEQYAMHEVRRFPPPYCFARLGPPAVGAALAAMLLLDPVLAATDAFEAWWASDDLELGHRMFLDDGNPVASWLYARTLDALATAMAAARRLDASINAHVGAVPTETSAALAQRAAHAPPVEASGRLAGAVRYRQGRDGDGEAVWVVAGARGLEIQQYFGRAWETLGPRGGIWREPSDGRWIVPPTTAPQPGQGPSGETTRARWLASLSPLARAFVLDHTRVVDRGPRRPVDRAGIETQLREHHHEPFEALVTFEVLLGGREVDLPDRTLHLGIVYGFLRPGQPAPVEGGLSMAPSGEILGTDSGAPFPRSGSVTSFIEHVAHFFEATVGPAPAFTLDVHGADADRLAAALGLQSVREAVDPYQQWWKDGGVTLFRSFVPDRVDLEILRAYTRRLEDAAGVLAAARSLTPEVRFDLGCTAQVVESCPRDAVPPDRSDLPAEHRYRHGSDSAYIDGEILVALGPHPRIEQLRALGGVPYEWDTLTVERRVRRVVRGDP